MLIKKLILTVGFLLFTLGSMPIVFADPPCSLSKQDFKALSQSTSALNPQSIAGLSEENQQNLCRTRALVNSVVSSPDRAALGDELTMQDIPKGWAEYLSPQESKIVRPVVAQVAAKNLRDRFNPK